MMWPSGGLMSGWMVLWGILAVAFWAGIIFLIIWAVRRFAGPTPPVHSRNALDILKERYARGELNKERFDQMKKDLS